MCFIPSLPLNLKIMKSAFTAFIIIYFLFLSLGYSYAYRAQELSDMELDSISAEGFDINIDAALAFRQALVVNQINIAAIQGATNNAANINNYNAANINSTSDGAFVNQENMAAVVATQGDITAARINNENHATIDSIASQLEFTQSNLGMLIALNGNIIDSRINNLNEATINGAIGTKIIGQQNIAIVVATGSIDAIINNINQISVAGGAFVNSSSTVTQSFSYKDFSGIITVNTN